MGSKLDKINFPLQKPIYERYTSVYSIPGQGLIRIEQKVSVDTLTL